MRTRTPSSGPSDRPVAAGSASRRAARWRPCAVVLGLVLGVWLCALALAQPRHVMIVVNSQGPLTKASAEQIRDIFLGKLRFMADVRAQPIQLQGPASEVMLRKVVGMSEREFRLYWVRKAYEDGVLPPPVRSTAAEVLRQVAREKGAIGFVDEAGFEPTDQVTVVYEVPAEGNS